MPTNESSRGRNQDRAKVAGHQEYEVNYESKKLNTNDEAVKEAVKKVGNQRTKVEGYLKKSGYQGF